MRNGGVGHLLREQVVEAAERVARPGELERMTIRSLAAELGVSPISLFRRVRDKDDLVEEVVDRLFAHRWRPGADRADRLAVEAARRARLQRSDCGSGAGRQC